MNFLAKIFIKNSADVTDLKVREKYGFLTGITGIICNILLFAGKLTVGLLSGAISIIADAVNNLSDAGSSVVTLLGFKLSGRPTDAEHPFGHGRIEYIAGLIVSMIILIVGFEVGKTAVEKIISPEDVNISVITVCILGASILVKLWMFFYNRQIGKKIDSAAMKATAIDSLSDVAATSVVLVCSIINYFTNVILDGYAGILVAIFIFYAGLKSVKEIISLLLGEKSDPVFVKKIADFVLSFDGVKGVHDIMVHNYGPGRQMISLHAEVPSNEDVLEIHDMIDNIEQALQETFKCHVVIHMDPIVVDDQRINEVRKAVTEIVKEYNSEYTIHDFRMNEGSTHSNLIFDMVTTYDKKISDEQAVREIKEKIKVLNPKFNAVITVDKPF